MYPSFAVTVYYVRQTSWNTVSVFTTVFHTCLSSFLNRTDGWPGYGGYGIGLVGNSNQSPLYIRGLNYSVANKTTSGFTFGYFVCVVVSPLESISGSCFCDNYNAGIHYPTKDLVSTKFKESGELGQNSRPLISQFIK